MEYDSQLCEQARVVRDRQMRSLPGAMSVLGTGAILLYPLLPATLWTGWTAALAIALLARSLYWWWQAPAATIAAARRHLRTSLAITALLSAMSCGYLASSASYLLPEYQIYLFGMVLAVGVLSMFVLGAHLPSYALLLAPFSATSVWMQWQMPHAVPGITGFTVLLLVLLLAGARRLNHLTQAAIANRRMGQDLVRQLEVQKGIAESLADSRARFLAAASHDLRQPMHALSLYLAALTDVSWRSPAAESMLVDARRCARNMDYQFRCLLDMTRLDTGTVPVEPSTFPIELILDRIRCEFMATAIQWNMPLKVAASDAVVESDPALVERILRYLVSNALRHAGYGRVLVSCRRRGDRLLVAVHDSGCGIAQDQQQLVFEEFYQVKRAHRERSRGLGLGLPLARRLARLLQTDIELKSPPDRGSCFQFALPLAVQRATHASLRPQHTNELQIVVVDDDPIMLEAVAVIVERWRCSIVRASSSRAAIRQLAANPRAPDLIITDFQLVEESGFDVIDAIQDEFNAAIPSVVVTGMRDVRAIRERGIPVLNKPVSAEQLQCVVQNLLPNIRLL